MVDYKNAQIVPGEYNSEASFANYSSKGPMLICHYTDEVWLHITDKEVPNVAPFYMISNYGKIYNHVQKHLNRLSIRYNGYVFTPLITVLRPKKYVNIDIHRVMMKCFYPLDDYTGLKHVCDIQDPLSETTWYSYIWNVNIPEGVSKAGIKVNENEFSIYEEDYYEKGTPLDEVTIYEPTSEDDNVKWVGWSENKPDGERLITNWSLIIGNNGVNKCRVFYGNWEKIQQ